MSLTNKSTELSRTETVKISVYTKDLRRCSHSCPFITKRCGEYYCTKYNETVDGRFEDTEDMYGFGRSERCINDFGFTGHEDEISKVPPDNLESEDFEEGYYYVKILDGSIMVMWLTHKSDTNGWEVLGKCPDYEELQRLKEENKRMAYDLGNQGYRIKNQRHEICNRLSEINKLRNLLKESCNELKILRMLSLPLASQEALNECDVLLTRLHAALGKEE